MHPYRRDPRAGRSADEDPLQGETSARVLDHEAKPGGIIFAISEARLHLIRIRPVAGATVQMSGASLDIGPERDIAGEILGTVRYRNLSRHAQEDLGTVVEGILTDNPEPFLSFFNRAGNLSLKMHAFQLLPGVGSKKAIEMVELRGRNGWDDFAALDTATGLDCKQLLAERLCEEIQDPRAEPRLVELLLRQEE